MLTIKSGSWWVTSKSDPRWNGNGRDDAVGGFMMPGSAQGHVEKMKKLLKEDPPDDLRFGYMKD